MLDDKEDKVTLVEVGPRDGLQNEPGNVPTDVKIELVKRLAAAGLTHIEATAFVSPKWVPQMADSVEVMSACAVAPELSHVILSALTPNMKGFDAAMLTGSREVAVFASASESFSQKNINCSIAESIARFDPIFAAASDLDIPVRAYVSCVIDCPYEGQINPAAVAQVSRLLYEKGAREISLGDTIGTGTPASVRTMLQAVMQDVPVAALAGHFHDTYGRGVANVKAALAEGVRVFDTSVGGLGGCPYAPGAAGNVATEDVLRLLQGIGYCQDIDILAIEAVAEWITAQLGRTYQRRIADLSQQGGPA